MTRGVEGSWTLLTIEDRSGGRGVQKGNFAMTSFVSAPQAIIMLLNHTLLGYCSKEIKALNYFTNGRASVKTLNCSDSA